MSSKIRIKMGEMEVEYEGSEEFLKAELSDLLRAVVELSKTAPITPPRGGTGAGTVVPKLTTASIAAKLAVKSGTELLIAAAAHLTLVAGADPFTRKQALDQMKSATAFYKKNYTTNLSKYIATAQKDDSLAEVRRGSYSLTAAKRADLGRQLADS